MKYTNKFTKDLSIGLIVKNEERVLRRCLESLQPLKEKINCEIIITDTGSTDKSIEIAKEYADKFIEFEWCDDFAKARNTGVEVAEGRWFLQIDADEFFDENVEKIAKFIKSQESQKYNSGRFVIYNYTSKRLKKYKKASLARLFDFSSGKKYFRHAIHESIPIEIEKCKDIDAVIHHDGYRPDNIDAKRNRNLEPMIKQLEENPNDLRIYAHLAEGYVSNKKSLEMCERGITVAKSGKEVTNRGYLSYLKSFECRMHHQMGNYPKVVELAKTYIEEGVLHRNAEVDIMYILANASIGVFDYKGAIDCFDKYFVLYKKLHAKLGKQDLFGVYYFDSQEEYAIAETKKIFSYIKLGELDTAKELLSEFEGYKYESEDEKLVIYLQYIKLIYELEEFSFVEKSYRSICDETTGKIEKERKRKYIINIIEEALYSEKDLDKKEKVLEGFAKNSPSDGYEALNQLRYYKGDVTKCSKGIEDLLEAEELLYEHIAFSDILYYKLRDQSQIVTVVNEYSLKQFGKYIDIILKRKGDGREIIYKLLMENKEWKEKVKNYIQIETAFRYLANCEELPGPSEIEKYEQVFECFLNENYDSMQQRLNMKVIFDNQELLSEKDAFTLIIKSVWNNRMKNPIECVKGLKKGLKKCESLKNCIEILANKIKEHAASEMKISEEFLALGIRVKQEIRRLISEKKFEEAILVLKKYEEINPKDMEIVDLYDMM